LTADLGFSVIEPFVSQFPGQFFNVGVAEQNMVGIAAGLASEGFRPYTYSIGIFPTFRCAEQLRNDVDYHDLPVVTTTVGSGVTYGALGYTHHAVQDLALMRSLPNMMIGTPADPQEVRAILDWHADNPQPLYLRMHKAGDPNIHESLGSVRPGQLLSIYTPQRGSSDQCIVVAGILAQKVVNILHRVGAQFPAFSLPLWGQRARLNNSSFLDQYQDIITVEDHLLDGGFGSWMLETAAISGASCRIHPVTLPSFSVGAVASESTLLSPVIDSLEKQIAMFLGA
jgi:transketolase